jgi:hypothetical protein
MPVFLWLEPLSEVPCNIQGTLALHIDSRWVSRTPHTDQHEPHSHCAVLVGALVQFGGSGTVYYALVIAFVLYMQVVRGTKVHAAHGMNAFPPSRVLRGADVVNVFF